MIAVIFEAWPAERQQQHYLDLAAELRPKLEALDGFISIERFQSLSETRKILSLSFFRDEEAIQRWRNLPEHRLTQATGRSEVFDNYRLRVATVLRDYGPYELSEAPADSRVAHERP